MHFLVGVHRLPETFVAIGMQLAVAHEIRHGVALEHHGGVVGQVVEKGQVLCIVEAMKLMNEIEAECKCKILKVCKENAQAVEFGDALFVIQKL